MAARRALIAAYTLVVDGADPQNEDCPGNISLFQPSVRYRKYD